MKKVASGELSTAGPFGPIRRVVVLDAASRVHGKVGGGVCCLVECPKVM
jgi:hypothetical protein